MSLPFPPAASAAGAGYGAPPIAGAHFQPPPPAAAHLQLSGLPLPPAIASKNPAHLAPTTSKNPGTQVDLSDEALSSMSPREQTALLSRQRHWRCAHYLFDRLRALPSYAPNSIHYNTLLRHLARARRWTKLRHLWLQMDRDSVPPSNPTYAALADALAKAGHAQDALLLLRHMHSRGVFPDEVSMNTFVRVLKDSGRFSVAHAFFKSWCDGRFELCFSDFDSSTCNLTGPMQFLLADIDAAPTTCVEGMPRKLKLTLTYNTLIDLYGKAGRIKDAEDVFANMLVSGVTLDTFTFNTMINVCGSHGNVEEAEALFEDMVVRGVAPDTKTFNVMMTVYASVGDVKGVLRYYHKIGVAGLSADAVSYKIVLQALCDMKMVQEVEDLIEEIQKSGACVHEQLLPVVMKMYIDLGLLDEANAFFEKNCRVDGVSSKNYVAIIDAYAEKGLWEEAEHVFCSERDTKFKKEIVEYNVMVKAYGLGKRYDKVSSLLENMRESGISPDECTYNSLIQMFSVGGFPQRAKKLLGKMKDAGYEPKCETYSAIIKSYSRNYLVSEAIDLYNEMKASGIEPNVVVYGLLIDMFAETGKVEEALHYSNLMEESGIALNKIVLTSLIKAYSRVNCWKEARDLYSRMKNMDGGPDIIASNSMLNLYANLGMVTEAKVIFDSLRRNRHADDVSYTTMMYLYKNMGLLNESIKIAHELQKSGLLSDCASYNAIMACYLAKGKLRDCAELVQQMVEDNISPDASTFKMIFCLLKKGHISPEEALQLESAYNDGRNFAKKGIIASLFSTAGMHTAALEACKQFLRPELAIDSCAYNVSIKAFASCGEMDKAFNLFMQMHDLGLKPDTVTYIHLAACYGKAGMSEGLRRINGLLKHSSAQPNNSLHKALIDAYRETGKSNLTLHLNKK